MKKTPPNIAVVILAAGASRRMGSAKQLLPWGETTLLKHTITTAQKTCANSIIVVLGANYNVIKKDIKDIPITIIKNNNWELGLGQSIACGASFVLKLKEDIDGVLFMLADQPFINSKYLNKIMNTFLISTNQIISTSYSDGKNGVPTLFDKCYLKELSTLSDDNGAKSILREYHDNVNVLDSKIENFDIDSKADYDLFFNKYFK